MRWASTTQGRSLATPGASGICPTCNGSVLAKCGEIVSWHWAHKSRDCDHWSEPESEWHRAWKAKFPERWQECTIGRHRADVVSAIGVIEFQRSFLSTSEIRERETFYSGLIWVVDASTWSLQRQKRKPTICIKRDRKGERISIEWKQDQSAQDFQWSRPRKNWITATRPVYLDIGNGSYHLFLLETVEVRKRKAIAVTRRIRKSDFLRMCYGLPLQSRPLLPDRSSSDWHAKELRAASVPARRYSSDRQQGELYAQAMRRRMEVITATKCKQDSILSGLPLFTAPSEP